MCQSIINNAQVGGFKWCPNEAPIIVCIYFGKKCRLQIVKKNLILKILNFEFQEVRKMSITLFSRSNIFFKCLIPF